VVFPDVQLQRHARNRTASNALRAMMLATNVFPMLGQDSTATSMVHQSPYQVLELIVRASVATLETFVMCILVLVGKDALLVTDPTLITVFNVRKTMSAKRTSSFPLMVTAYVTRTTHPAEIHQSPARFQISNIVKESAKTDMTSCLIRTHGAVRLWILAVILTVLCVQDLMNETASNVDETLTVSTKLDAVSVTTAFRWITR